MADDLEMPPVDAGMLRFSEELSAATPPEAVGWPLEKQRQAWNAVCRVFRAPRPKNIDIEDLAIEKGPLRVPLRIYRRSSAKRGPAVIYLHGGGWVLGSIETHDDMCAEIADAADVTVVAVDYRLAPEHPHPAQLEDTLTALDWMRREGGLHGIDPHAIVAAGDSAGGQMSASLAIYLRDRKLPQLRGQVLIYPVLGIDLATPSYLRNANAPCLTRADMIYYWHSVLGPTGNPNWSDKYIIPLLETDYEALPPAYITAAGHDPLYDDALIYADRLQKAGVPALTRHEPTLAHSYMRARNVSKACGAGFAAIANAIRCLARDGRLPESA